MLKVKVDFRGGKKWKPEDYGILTHLCDLGIELDFIQETMLLLKKLPNIVISQAQDSEDETVNWTTYVKVDGKPENEQKLIEIYNTRIIPAFEEQVGIKGTLTII